MGGRGASSGSSKLGNRYGSQYRTLYQAGNIKFIARSPGAREEPMETITAGRVYATVKESGALKSIYYFDNRNRRMKQIDLDHFHRRRRPHAHRGYEHQEYDPLERRMELSPRERKLVDRVLKTWENKNRGN